MVGVETTGEGAVIEVNQLGNGWLDGSHCESLCFLIFHPPGA